MGVCAGSVPGVLLHNTERFNQCGYRFCDHVAICKGFLCDAVAGDISRFDPVQRDAAGVVATHGAFAAVEPRDIGVVVSIFWSRHINSIQYLLNWF